MGIVEIAIVVAILMTCAAGITAWVANIKGLDSKNWLLLGVLFNVVALYILVVGKESRRPDTKHLDDRIFLITIAATVLIIFTLFVASFLI